MGEDQIIVNRVNDCKLWNEDGTNLQTAYTYPYRAFPELKSHLHPKFVIFDAGKKLEKLMGISDNPPVVMEILNVLPSRPATISNIVKLYSAWIRNIPQDALDDISYVDPNEELVSELEDGSDGGDGDDSEDGDYKGYDSRTKSRRGNGKILCRITRSISAKRRGGQSNQTKFGNGGSKTRRAPAVKRKVLSDSSTHNQHLLSEATLSRLNQQSGESIWTSDHIRHWSHSKTFPKRRKFVSSLSVL